MTDDLDDLLRRSLRDAAPRVDTDPGAVLEGLRTRMGGARRRRLVVTGVSASLLLVAVVAVAALAATRIGGDGAEDVSVADDPTPDVADPPQVSDGDPAADDLPVAGFEPGPSATPGEDGLVTFNVEAAVVTIRSTGTEIDLFSYDTTPGWSVIESVDDATVVEIAFTDGVEVLRWRAELVAGRVTTAFATQPGSQVAADPTSPLPTVDPATSTAIPDATENPGDRPDPTGTPTGTRDATVTPGPTASPTPTDGSDATVTPGPTASPTPTDGLDDGDDTEDEDDGEEDEDDDGDDTEDEDEAEEGEDEEDDSESSEPQDSETSEVEETESNDDDS